MTTIAYDLPVKDLIAGLNATGHVTHRSYAKKSVTLHHNGGRLSHEGVLNVWKTRPASAQFDIDKAGAAAQYVKSSEYAWAVGNTTGNIETISIEMCNLTTAPKWLVDPVTWKAAARLAGWLFANVIDSKPRPSMSNLHYHHFWKSTDCAGPYMDTVYPQVLAEAQQWYDHFSNPPVIIPPKEDTLSAAEVKQITDAIAASEQRVKDYVKIYVEDRSQAYANFVVDNRRQTMDDQARAVWAEPLKSLGSNAEAALANIKANTAK
jgi:hypothetical protein